MSDPIRVQLPADATTGPRTNAKADTQQKQNEQNNGQAAPAQAAPERPAHVPEKFWKDGKLDSDALLKSYTELEKSNSSKPKKDEQPGEKSDNKDAANADEKKKDDGSEKQPDQNDAQVEEQFKPFFEEFEKDGKLSEESYAKLAKEHKLPRAVVDQYINGFKVTQASQAQRLEETTKKVFEQVGGEENYTQMAQWARDNLSDAELAAYNSAVESNDPAQIDLAVSGLYQKFSLANGRPQVRLRGSNASNVSPFKSTVEVRQAMSDPRYRSDPAYRQEVEDRLRLSDVF